jgi:hypothetical protein
MPVARPSVAFLGSIDASRPCSGRESTAFSTPSALFGGVRKADTLFAIN